MLFEGNDNILVLPRVSGETSNIFYNKGYSIVNKLIGNVEELNRELRETNREVNMKFLNVKYF